MKGARDPMKVYYLQPGDRRWDDLLAQTDHDLYHLPEYVEIAAEHEGGRPVAAVVTDGRSSLMLPLVLRPLAVAGRSVTEDLDAVSPYGYPHPLFVSPHGSLEPAFVPGAFARLTSSFRDQRIITAFVRLHPLLPFPVQEAMAIGPIVNHGQTVAIDLTRDTDTIRAEMRENHSRWVRRGLEAGHKFVVADTHSDMADFIDIYADNMAFVEASAYYFFSQEYFEALIERLSGRVHLAFLEIDGQRACGMILSEVGGIVEYHLGGTRSEFRCQSPMVLLTYEVALWAKKRGNRVLHLGGGVGGCTDSLFRFKAGFSNSRYPYRTWRIVADLEAYEALVREWERIANLPADPPTGFFPAYRRPVPREILPEPTGVRQEGGETICPELPLVIVGAGGHGREVLGLFLARGEAGCVAGFVDDSPLLRDCPVDDKPVLGGLAWLVGHASRYRAIVAVGDNTRRREVVERLARTGVAMSSVVAASAKVSPFANLAEGVMICTNAVVNSGASVGAHSIVNTAATVSHDAAIGSFVHLAPGAHIGGGASVGDGVLLGTGAVVNPMVNVGAWSTVGSGAVVARDVAAGRIAYGVPAREHVSSQSKPTTT